MMANRRGWCPLPMASRMNGNFWTEVMTMRLPSWSNDDHPIHEPVS